MRSARPLVLLATALCASLAAAPALAHFTLDAPACMSRQDFLGSPQKSAPCGQADPGQMFTPTNMVTAVASGGMLTLSLTETIFHPGHYRIAIAPDMASLPADPAVTALGSTPCGRAEIMATPALPVLADGVLVHTAAFSGQQTVQIPLPPGFTCDRCVLQVVEFMSNHALNNPGGCFYHHCAVVNVGTSSTDAGSPADASGTMDASTDSASTPDAASAADSAATMEASSDGSAQPADAGNTTTSRGCGCRAPAGRRSAHGALALGALGAALALRRRR